MSQATQTDRFLQLESPLGKDVLLLNAFTGREEMSRPFSFHLEMLSHNDSINPTEIVGKDVTIALNYAKDGGDPRYFHGFVSRFSAGTRETGFRRYDAEVVPWFWFLTRTSDCQIFQEKSVPEIVEEVFSNFGFKAFEMGEVKENHPKLKYCVQYRETAFNFVSRLLEQEGIFYFFRHEKSKHTMVLADQKGAYKDLPQKSVELDYTYDNVERIERLNSWNHEYEFTPGKWAETDHCFIKFPAQTWATPAERLITKENSLVKWSGIDKYEMYDYPGEYKVPGDGKRYTKTRMEEDEVPHDRVRASGNCHTFTLGGKFEITHHDCEIEKNKKYVITAIQHSGSEPSSYGGGIGGGDGYSNSFTCIPESVIYRPARITPKPVVHGTHTAVVVGPPGEEIYPDKYGRVKIQFFWDRYHKRDEKASRWCRVAQASAGINWGSMFIPRVGQEVVVSYGEGDPDHPLITGLVYNAEQMPAYALPDHKTMSWIKTNSSPGGDGFNEIRFEDKKDKEQIFIHAERNMDVRVKHDSFERILNHRHQIIGWDKDGKKGGDQKEMVYQDKHLNIKRDQMEHIEGNVYYQIGGGEADKGGTICTLINENDIKCVKKNQQLGVDGDRVAVVAGKDSLTVKGEYHFKASKNSAVESSQAIHIKAGTSLVIEAGTQLSLKVGGNFIDIGPAGVAIKGTMVMINSGGAAGTGAGSSPDTSVPILIVDPVKPEIADNSKTGKKSMPDSLS